MGTLLNSFDKAKDLPIHNRLFFFSFRFTMGIERHYRFFGPNGSLCRRVIFDGKFTKTLSKIEMFFLLKEKLTEPFQAVWSPYCYLCWMNNKEYFWNFVWFLQKRSNRISRISKNLFLLLIVILLFVYITRLQKHTNKWQLKILIKGLWKSNHQYPIIQPWKWHSKKGDYNWSKIIY